MESIKKYDLDFEKAYRYFIDHIECGKTLSELIVENICFQKGMFYTFLPHNAIIERLHELSYGGIIPTNVYDASGHLIGPNPPGSKVCSGPKTIDVLSLYIKDYFIESSLNLAVIEDCIREITDPFSPLEKV